jgi:hypothetical protein
MRGFEGIAAKKVRMVVAIEIDPLIASALNANTLDEPETQPLS